MNRVPILISVTMMITNVCLGTSTCSVLTNFLNLMEQSIEIYEVWILPKTLSKSFFKLTWNCLPGRRKIRRKLKKCSNIIGSENEITFELHVKIFNRFIHRKFPIFSIFESNLNIKKSPFFYLFCLKASSTTLQQF